ncbi:hypothetical protein AWENTII_011101 [Aspergillus wentii]
MIIPRSSEAKLESSSQCRPLTVPPEFRHPDPSRNKNNIGHTSSIPNLFVAANNMAILCSRDTNQFLRFDEIEHGLSENLLQFNTDMAGQDCDFVLGLIEEACESPCGGEVGFGLQVMLVVMVVFGLVRVFKVFKASRGGEGGESERQGLQGYYQTVQDEKKREAARLELDESDDDSSHPLD